jgi:molybdopterin-guanine dinucleotide biosynthesis protein A
MGRDKAALPFGNETMLARVVRIVRAAVPEVVLVARADQPIPDGWTVVRDRVEGLGPLPAIAAGLRHITAERAFVAACDMPFLQPALVRRMLALCEGYDAAVAVIDGFTIPTAAVYAHAIAHDAEELVASGQLSPRALLERVRTRQVMPDELTIVDPTLESFRNCNSPASYEAALRDAGLLSP